MNNIKRVDILAYARTAYGGLPQKRLDEDLSRIVPRVPPMTKSINGHDPVSQWTRPNQSMDTTQSINGHDPVNQWTRPSQLMDTSQSINALN